MSDAVPAPWEHPVRPGPTNAPGGGAPGNLVVHVRGSIMTSGTPSLTVDGHPMNARHGQNVIGLGAGQRTVRIHSKWMRSYGKAELEVTVPPGGAVDVYYAAPLSQWVNRGNIGLTKQKRPDTVGFIAFMAAVTVVVSAITFLVMT